jgi:hypothetical protein
MIKCPATESTPWKAAFRGYHPERESAEHSCTRVVKTTGGVHRKQHRCVCGRQWFDAAWLRHRREWLDARGGFVRAHRTLGWSLLSELAAPFSASRLPSVRLGENHPESNAGAGGAGNCARHPPAPTDGALVAVARERRD